ncbi:MAG: GDSL-type esterase/lipase family protein [Planctomycetota bacterium]|nr:GDSL-type esterase/lipase family protein [Planctomycetota bacterium]
MTNPMHRFLLAALLASGSAFAQEAPKTAPAKADAPKQVAPAKAPSATAPVDRADDWWKQRQAAFNERVKQAAEKGDAGMLFIGDSITQGWEGEGKEVWEEFYAKRNAINLGIGGDRTEHVLWRLDNGNLKGLDNPKAGAAPKVAVIMIGTNNVGNTEPADTAAGVEAMVLVLGIFPREEKPGKAREKNTKVNEIISKLADDKSVFYMDIGASFTETDGSLSKKIMPDFLHLSKDGYRRWAMAIESKVTELLK